jgi:hypothetical protein
MYFLSLTDRGGLAVLVTAELEMNENVRHEVKIRLISLNSSSSNTYLDSLNHPIKSNPP